MGVVGKVQNKISSGKEWGEEENSHTVHPFGEGRGQGLAPPTAWQILVPGKILHEIIRKKEILIK